MYFSLYMDICTVLSGSSAGTASRFLRNCQAVPAELPGSSAGSAPGSPENPGRETPEGAQRHPEDTKSEPGDTKTDPLLQKRCRAGQFRRNCRRVPTELPN